MNTKMILLPVLSLLIFFSLVACVSAYSLSDFSDSLNQLSNRFIALFLPRPSDTDIVPTILGIIGWIHPTTTTTTTTTTTFPHEPAVVFTTINANNGNLIVPVNFAFTISDTVYKNGINKNSIKYYINNPYTEYTVGWTNIPASKCIGDCETGIGTCTCTIENLNLPLSNYIDYTSSYGYVLITPYRIFISALSDSKNVGGDEWFRVTGTIQNNPPRIIVTSPANESVVTLPFDVLFTVVDDSGVNKSTTYYEILDIAGNVIDRKSAASSCATSPSVLTCELPGRLCTCSINGITASLMSGTQYVLRIYVNDTPTPITIYGSQVQPEEQGEAIPEEDAEGTGQQQPTATPLQGSVGIVFTTSGASFAVTAFDCSQIASGQYKCAVQYSNPLSEQVLFSFVFSKIGRAIVKTVTVPPGSGTAEVTFSCSESPGMNVVSWRAFRASNHRVPIAWSLLTTLKTISC